VALGYYKMVSEWVEGSGLLHHGECMGRWLWATTQRRVNGFRALGYYIMDSEWVGGSGLLHHGE
jgi:hypothetical protein